MHILSSPSLSGSRGPLHTASHTKLRSKWYTRGNKGGKEEDLFCPRDAQRVCSLKSNGHKTRPSWLSRVQEAQRAVPHATADDAVHGAFMTLPRYTYTREDACDALAHRSQDGRVLDSLCLQRSGPNACRVRLCITKCPPELGYT